MIRRFLCFLSCKNWGHMRYLGVVNIIPCEGISGHLRLVPTVLRSIYVCGAVIVSDPDKCLRGESGFKFCYSSFLSSSNVSFQQPCRFPNPHIRGSMQVEEDAGCEGGGRAACPGAFSEHRAIPHRLQVCPWAMRGWPQISEWNPLCNVGVLGGCSVSELRGSHHLQGARMGIPL